MRELQIDRLCLNCHRMEQTECECPCECPLEMNYCTGDLLEEEDRFVHDFEAFWIAGTNTGSWGGVVFCVDENWGRAHLCGIDARVTSLSFRNPSCRSYPEAPEEATVPAAAAEALPQCVHTRCADRRTKSACLGVMDCEWCVLEHDGKTPLGKPFCSSQRVCFAGVLGASTPYRDEIMGTCCEERKTKSKRTLEDYFGVWFLSVSMAVWFVCVMPIFSELCSSAAGGGAAHVPQHSRRTCRRRHHGLLPRARARRLLLPPPRAPQLAPVHLVAARATRHQDVAL